MKILDHNGCRKIGHKALVRVMFFKQKKLENRGMFYVPIGGHLIGVQVKFANGRVVEIGRDTRRNRFFCHFNPVCALALLGTVAGLAAATGLAAYGIQKMDVISKVRSWLA